MFREKSYVRGGNMLDNTFSPEQLRSKLAEARAQGAKRVRRITRPTLTAGLLLMASAVVTSSVTSMREGAAPVPGVGSVTISLNTVAAYLIILAVTPLQPRAVSRVAALLSVLVLVPVFYLVNTFVPAHLRNARADCAAYADPRTRCRVELVLLILRALCVPVNGAASAHLLWRLRRKASVFQRVDAIWVAFSASWFLPGLSAVIAFTTGTYISDLAVQFQSEASGVTMLFFSLLGMSKGVRRRAHGWLASIGGETSAAVTISTMFAGGGLRADEDMLARTHATLCSVSAAHVTLAAFCSSESADELFDATSPARLGEIDAFISHRCAARRALPPLLSVPSAFWHAVPARMPSAACVCRAKRARSTHARTPTAVAARVFAQLVGRSVRALCRVPGVARRVQARAQARGDGLAGQVLHAERRRGALAAVPAALRERLPQPRAAPRADAARPDVVPDRGVPRSAPFRAARARARPERATVPAADAAAAAAWP